MQDSYYMNEAIKLALKGSIYTHPNPKVGCIIVKNKQIIGKGYHKYFGGDHAEVNAVKYCLKKFKKDKHSTLGLTKSVNKRKKLLTYLKKRNVDSYQKVIKQLNLRK